MKILIETTVSGTIHLLDVPKSAFEKIETYIGSLIEDPQKVNAEKSEEQIKSKPSISDVKGMSLKGTIEYDQMRKVFGRRMESRRMKKGMSRHQFANQIGVGDGTVHQWAYGITFPSARHRAKIENLLGEDIFDGLDGLAV